MRSVNDTCPENIADFTKTMKILVDGRDECRISFGLRDFLKRSSIEFDWVRCTRMKMRAVWVRTAGALRKAG